jgi:hypothetical protein
MRPLPLVRTSPRAEHSTVESAALDASAEVSSPGRRSRARADADALAERVGSVASTSRAPSRRLPVWEYVQAELGLTVGAREHDPDMAVARERVFDIIWYIPIEFERLNLYGGALCADAILGVVTSLPVRVLCQTARLVVVPWSSWSSRRGAKRGEGVEGGDGPPFSPAALARAAASKKPWGFHPYAREHLSDSLWLCILAGAVVAAGHVDVSVLYHYIRGQEVIKLYLACSVLECFDKLCSAFNCHVLDALQNSVFLVVSASARSDGRGAQAVAWAQLAFDTGLALATTTAHTLILLTHAVTLSVAINSHTNAMLLVLVSNNFGEIKGHVFKKMDEAKVFTAARMDIVERVHLSVQLLFVAAQRVTASGSVALGLDRKLLVDSMMVLGSEVGVDVFKHAFVSKFNGLRPRVYRGFFRQLCREHVKLTQSYKLHRVVGFVPLAPAAVLLKTLPGLYRTFGAGSGGGSGSRGLFFGVGRDVLAFARDTARSALRSALNRAGLETFETFEAFEDEAEGAGFAAEAAAELDAFSFVAKETSRDVSGARFFSAGAVSETAGFALLFAFLVVFKLAFGVALHWFGARMLDTLPKDVGGGRKKEPKERAGDAAEPPNPWRNPGTRVLFQKKPERDTVGSLDRPVATGFFDDKRKDATSLSASETRAPRPTETDRARSSEKKARDAGTEPRPFGTAEGDATRRESSVSREKTENGLSPRFADAVRARSSGNGAVWMRGDASARREARGSEKSADSLLTAGLSEARATPAAATPAPATGSPKRASLDVPFTPGSPHYKLYPEYQSGV